MTKKMMAHNMPPKVIDDFLILDADGKSTGRIRITNTIMSKHLVRKTNDKHEYVERVINDSEKIGLKAKINTGGSKSFFFQKTFCNPSFPFQSFMKRRNKKGRSGSVQRTLNTAAPFCSASDTACGR